MGTLGRYTFECHFESETQGHQTNLTTGKVRRLMRKQKGEPLPAWEGTGTRRRAAAGGLDMPAAPENTAAAAAAANRATRRANGGYPGGGTVQPQQRFPLRKPPSKEGPAIETNRPQVSQTAHKVTQAPSGNNAVPHFMRPRRRDG